MLNKICKCKGSINYVHESCLVKWITTMGGNSQNQKRCEICQQEYRITYEFDSVFNCLMKACNYAMRDKRRLVRGLLYALYLWIFFKRFIQMIKSMVRFTERMIMSSFKYINYSHHLKRAQSQSAFLTRMLVDNPSDVFLRTFVTQIRQRIRKLFSLSNFVTTFIGLVGFLYRMFIFIQMCILFYGETVRIKKYIVFLVDNSKKIKINQYKED